MDSVRQANPNRFAYWSVAIGVVITIIAGLFTWVGMFRTPERAEIVRNAVKTAATPRQNAYQPPSDNGYVGSDACFECHRTIAEAYKSHPMARSITTIDANSAETRIAPIAAHVDGKVRCFDVEMRDGVMLHHERMYDSTGEQIYDQAVSMDYAVGSGKRARAYLYQVDHVMFMSPLNWYSQSQKWDLAPGYVPDDPRRFDRRVTDECLSCHAGRVASAGRSLNMYRKPPFLEMAIGCENCHGPGEQHVAIRTSGQVVVDGADPIINPAHLDASRRESVCNQCHLQAAVRLPRDGRSDLDFRPGRNLDEIWAVLDIKRPMTADGRTHSVNHVQQMRESRCFTRSGGRFGCTSCHDPHSVPALDERAAFYRQKCLACHTESSCSEAPDRRQANDNACATCHMPERKSSNVSHVTQTDHRVIRTTNPTSGDEDIEDSDTLTFFDDQNLRLDPSERDRAMGLGAWVRLTKTGRRPPRQLGEFLNRVLETSPNDGLLLAALGSMAQENQRFDLARTYYERARQIPAAEEAALAGLLDIDYGASDWENALKCADRLVEINPRTAKAHSLRADILAFLGKPSEGIDAARQALKLNPTLIPVRRWLVKAYRIMDREQEALDEEAVIQRMENARLPGPK